MNAIETRFFFEGQDAWWGDQELGMWIGSEVPNGPALLVLCRRGDVANPFGIVSMSNRAWTIAQPLDHMGLYARSAKRSGMKRSGWKVAAVLVGVLVVAWATYGCGCFILSSGMLFPGFRNWFTRWTGLAQLAATPQQIVATARGLMHRISKDADRYWPSLEGGSGRL